jgi:hypothetical protein
MQSLLHVLRPSAVRWIPHDIVQPGSESSTHKKQSKDKEKPKRRTLLSFNKPTEPNHGAPKRRKSVLSLTDNADEECDARTHMQGESMLFARVPIEIRKMVYEFVVGVETVHLTLGTKKRFGHFVCPAADEVGCERRDCECKVLVGGAGHGGRLSSAGLRMLRVCRRM